MNFNKKRKKVIDWWKVLLGIAICVLTIVTVFQAYNTSAPVGADLNYLDFLQMVEDGNIEKVYMVSTQKYFIATDILGNQYTIVSPGHDEFKKELLESGVSIEISSVSAFEAVTTAILSLPMLILIFVFVSYFMKATQGTSNTLFKVLKNEEAIKFEDVAGMSEIKEEVKFAVAQLKNASKLRELGAKPIKGIILEGPPGVGKTLLARAIAGEADVPFIATSGADFIEMFAGLGAARVRKLWEIAELNAPCILFIDEVDAVGRRRSGGGDGATTEANQTLNELLTKMDGLKPNTGIFVIAATNRVQDLDPALLRPGRFDKQLFVGPPRTKKDRDEIVSLYLKTKKTDETVKLDAVSRLLFGLSGAEIAFVLNDAVLVSLQRGGNGIISLSDIDTAALKHRAHGVATDHASTQDIHVTSVHESGHAVMSAILGRKVSKISIVPYSSGVGGMTIRDTDDIENIKIMSRSELNNEIKVLLAGRAAEQILLGDTSSGCENDIERATILVYKMLFNLAMDKNMLANQDALESRGMAIIDKSKSIEKVNEYLISLNQEVIDTLESHKDEIIRLSEQLAKEENILDYEYAGDK